METGQVRAQLDRILASTAFAGAERSSRFLRFVIDRALDGRREEIKETVIGVEVLGRNPSFDPKTDPIVRVEAGRLRTRLAAYYETEGKTDPILISLPKGGYSPEFCEQRPPTAQPVVPRLLRMRSILPMAAGAVVGLIAAMLGMRYFPAAPARDDLKASILPPPGVDIVSSVISPDGRRIAFSGISGTKQKLWVRDLDSLEVRPLNGTENAAYPFWSPDSRSLGFFGVDKIKRIDILRGAAQNIPATPSSLLHGRAAAWCRSPPVAERLGRRPNSTRRAGKLLIRFPVFCPTAGTSFF